MNPKLRNRLVSVYSKTLYRFVKPGNYALISQNQKFKDLHKGKRCFILGNGPSLKSQDLSVLKDEVVFTVNQAARNPQFPQICSNYHFWVDQLFFRDIPGDEGVKELIETMTSVNDNVKGEKPECFFPVNQAPFIRKHGLDQKINVNYVSMQHTMISDDFPTDLTKPLPKPATVVHTCIMAAIYMGFREIYLLGCDNTGIVVNVNSYLKQNSDSDYAYHVTENEKKRMNDVFKDQSLEWFAYSFYKNLVYYRYIADHCKKNGITIKNCSPVSTIESIEKIDLGEVLSL